MSKNPLFKLAALLYGWVIKIAEYCLQPLFLLIVRLYWGWQFFEAGQAKLEDVPKFTKFFQNWGIPYPELNVHLAGGTECIGGLLLLIGFGSRVFTAPLIFTMIIAYISATPEIVKNIFNAPDDFVTATPFLFLLAAVIVFVFGPGPLSVDGLIGLVLKRRAAAQTPAA
jgi:putative oxidoreductase